jgi:PilZ domain-containing protein
VQVMLQPLISRARRRSSRVHTPEGVWVYWGGGGRDDTSRVLNLSLGGLFIETREPRLIGAKTKVDFLVQEGQIRLEAVVRHVSSGRGLGLKFTAVRDEDRPHLAALVNRQRRSS